MVDSSRRRAARAVMGSHNRCWIWGRNVVLETVKAARWPILELLIAEELAGKPGGEALRLAERQQVPVLLKSAAELTKACRSEEHQGFAARMAPFPCQDLDEFLSKLPKGAAIVLLDRLQDPFNFGAIIRSASTLGIDGIVIGDREQADVNSQVARSSAGAVNHLPIARTADLAAAADQLRKLGFQIVGASEKATVPLYDADFRKSTVVIIGNEGRGIRPELLSRCDVSVAIPLAGRVGSLNAAVAAGILFYELQRQRIGERVATKPRVEL